MVRFTAAIPFYPALSLAQSPALSFTPTRALAKSMSRRRLGCSLDSRREIEPTRTKRTKIRRLPSQGPCSAVKRAPCGPGMFSSLFFYLIPTRPGGTASKRDLLRAKWVFIPLLSRYISTETRLFRNPTQNYSCLQYGVYMNHQKLGGGYAFACFSYLSVPELEFPPICFSSYFFSSMICNFEKTDILKSSKSWTALRV